MSREIIDMLFLELSQFTGAKTALELHLEDEVGEVKLKAQQLQAENAKLKEENRTAASIIKRFLAIAEALKGGCWE